MTPFVARLLTYNQLEEAEYVEPYAGGGSLALSLLHGGLVSRVHLNDLDNAVYSFWWSVLNDTDELLRRIHETPVSIDEWKRQKAIYRVGVEAGRLDLGFSFLYLNRTNHSGILNAGPIGGMTQQGKWRIDARFNKAEIQRRIIQTAKLKERIAISNQDALKFLTTTTFPRNTFIYLDPPYFNAGSALYLNSYAPNDHECVKAFLESLSFPWILSYDDVDEIRRLYAGVAHQHLTLLHTARSTRLGHEIVFFSPSLSIPPDNVLSGSFKLREGGKHG